MTQACHLPNLAAAHHEQAQSLVNHTSFLATATATSASPASLHHRIAAPSDTYLLSNKPLSHVATVASGLAGPCRAQIDPSSMSLLDMLRSLSDASKESHKHVAKRASPCPEASNIGPRPIRREKFPPTPLQPIPRRSSGQHQRPLMPKMSLLDVPPYPALEVSGTSVWSAVTQPNSPLRPSSASTHSPTPSVLLRPQHLAPYPCQYPWPRMEHSTGHFESCHESKRAGRQHPEHAVRQHFGSKVENGLFDSLEQLALTASAGPCAHAVEHGAFQDSSSVSSDTHSSSSVDQKTQDDFICGSQSDVQSTPSPGAPLSGHVSSPPMHALQALSLAKTSMPSKMSLPFLPPLERAASALLRKSSAAKSTPPGCVGQVPDDVVCFACRKQFDDQDGFMIVRPGELLCERYFVEKVLGQGTFGTVLQVLDLRLQAKLGACDKDRRVNFAQCRMALKIIRSSPKYRIACRSEISILETIHQPLDAFLACLSTADEQAEVIFQGPKYCIRMHYWFEYRHHLCMVFPLLQTDLYCFMEKTHFSPFSLSFIQQIGKQLLTAVTYLHSLGVIHTDLKPENIMLLSQDLKPKEGLGTVVNIRDGLWASKMASPNISLIDFGSAVQQDDYHADIVSTRHYRAPEITLELGWSFPCDTWSVGCILMELFLGHQLFKTHDVSTHLKLMEVLLGPFPDRMVHPAHYVLSNKTIPADAHPRLPFFDEAGKVIFPLKDTPPTSIALVQAIRPLSNLIPASLSEGHRLFLDLVASLLTLDPLKRISSRGALFHPFFSCSLVMEEEDGYPF